MARNGEVFLGVTETTGNKVTRTAVDMALTRYSLAARFSEAKAVLEVACGPGPGLGYLRRKAQRVVAGDYTAGLLSMARRQYGSSMPLVRLDAQTLPFRGASFDVVLLYEAIYYLQRPTDFLDEARRVLRPGGTLLICTPNHERNDFNPSPHSTRYLGAAELDLLLRSKGFQPELLGAFADGNSRTRRVVSILKRGAVQLGLMPRTMKGKAFFKRVFLGPLVPFPAELCDESGTRHEPTPLRPDASEAARYKVLYAVGHLS